MVRITILFLISVMTAFAQDFSVRAYTDTNVYLIGDQFKLYYDIRHREGISFAEPPFRDSISNIDIIAVNTAPSKKLDGVVQTRYEIILSRYDSADVEIPPLKFFYWVGAREDRAPFLLDEAANDDTTLLKAYSNPVSIRINAVKVNMEEDIRDIKEPLTIPLDWRIVLLYIIAGIIILAVLFLIYNKFFRKKKLNLFEQKYKDPPHIVALNSLKELENRQLWQRGLIKEFHSEITGIIRQYFELRFSLPALEITTGETISRLKSNKEAEKIAGDAEIFLSNADLVKFAKFIPMNEINEEMMKKAYIIVEQTKPVREQEEPADVQ